MTSAHVQDEKQSFVSACFPSFMHAGTVRFGRADRRNDGGRS